MSIKAKIAAGTAAFAFVGSGVAMAVPLTASAATPSCSHTCDQLFTQKYGPRYVMDVDQGRAAAGQPVILFQASNSDKAEDFTFRYLGSADTFYHHHGLVSPGFDEAFGGDPVIEIEYAPYGLNSNFCVSTKPGATAQPGAGVSLQRCGRYASSLWAVDSGNAVRDHRSEGGDDPLINGSTNRFSNPLVLNYPAGHPADMPRPQLNVQPEKRYSDGATFDNQEWGAWGSPVHGVPMT